MILFRLYSSYYCISLGIRNSVQIFNAKMQNMTLGVTIVYYYIVYTVYKLTTNPIIINK